MKNDVIQKSFLEWKGVAAIIKELIRAKEKQQIQTLMDKGLSLFYEVIFAVNESNLPPGSAHLNDLPIKPFNLADRINFIQIRKSSFHSFKQLEELFFELEKQYAKKASLERI